MNKLIKSSLTLLALFFCFSALSRPDISQYYPPLYKNQYLFHLFLNENKNLEAYEVMSVSQMDDYLIFNIEKMETDDLKHSRTRKNQECFLKRIVPKEELESIAKYSKIVFSIKELEQYNLTEPGDPDFPLPVPLPYKERPDRSSVEEPGDPDFPLPAPLPYKGRPDRSSVEEPGDPDFPLPAPLPYGDRPDGSSVEEPGDPDFPLPAPLPYKGRPDRFSVEEPGDPDFPLPAPLPYKERSDETPSVEEPGDPDFPLPAPLPFYISPYTGRLIISHKHYEDNKVNNIILNLDKVSWNYNVKQVLKEYFHRLEDTCNN